MKRIFLLSLLVAFTALSASAIRLKHRPWLQNVGETEATIVWVTDCLSVGWVELAPDDGSHFYQRPRQKFWHSAGGIKQKDSVHVVRLTGLQPGVRYRYRVGAQEVLGHRGTSVRYGDAAVTDMWRQAPYSFVTASTAAPSVSFAVVNDIHDNAPRLEKLVGLCNAEQTDFFVFNGDMLSQFTSQERMFKGFMDTATRLFASEKPIVYARGNHETRHAFASAFHRYFAPCRPQLYYTFRRGPVFFVVLDTGEDKPDCDPAYSSITDFDAYRTEQAEWLRGVVNSEAYRTAPFRVVIAHMPPLGGWHGTREVQEKFIPLLRQSAPDLMICGHLHQNIHQAPTAEVPFPILVNSHTSAVQATATAETLSVKILGEDGKTLNSFEVKKK